MVCRRAGRGSEVKLNVQTDFRAVGRLLATMPAEVVDQAARRALNRAVDTGKTRMVRAIRQEYALSSELIRDKLRVTAARKGGGFELQATLAARGRRGVNVIRFLERSVTLAEGRRRGKAGTQGRLYVQIRRGGPKKALPAGSFVGNKGRTVFQRLGKSRLPIKALATIDVPSMFNARRLNAVVRQAMLETFRKRFDHEAKRLLSR